MHILKGMHVMDMEFKNVATKSDSVYLLLFLMRAKCKLPEASRFMLVSKNFSTILPNLCRNNITEQIGLVWSFLYRVIAFNPSCL